MIITPTHGRLQASLCRIVVNLIDKMGIETTASSFVNFFKSLSSPAQIFLLVAVVFVIRKIVQSRIRKFSSPPPEKPLEPMKKRDFTPQELLDYDGVKQKRVLLAINGRVFDVTRGKDFYGPGQFAKGIFVITFAA